MKDSQKSKLHSSMSSLLAKEEYINKFLGVEKKKKGSEGDNGKKKKQPVRDFNAAVQINTDIHKDRILERKRSKEKLLQKVLTSSLKLSSDRSILSMSR